MLLTACAAVPGASAPSSAPPAAPRGKPNVLPNYLPLGGGPRPDFSSAGPEYEDGFLRYPADANLLVKQTNVARRVQLNQVFTDAVTDIILGRRPVSDLDQLVKDWQNGGGNQIRTELQRGLAG